MSAIDRPPKTDQLKAEAANIGGDDEEKDSAPMSKGKRARLKREAFLARVRSRAGSSIASKAAEVRSSTTRGPGVEVKAAPDADLDVQPNRVAWGSPRRIAPLPRHVHSDSQSDQVQPFSRVGNPPQIVDEVFAAAEIGRSLDESQSRAVHVAGAAADDGYGAIEGIVEAAEIQQAQPVGPPVVGQP